MIACGALAFPVGHDSGGDRLSAHKHPAVIAFPLTISSRRSRVLLTLSSATLVRGLHQHANLIDEIRCCGGLFAADMQCESHQFSIARHGYGVGKFWVVTGIF